MAKSRTDSEGRCGLEAPNNIRGETTGEGQGIGGAY